MERVVLDASVVIGWFSSNGSSIDDSIELHAPSLIDYEFQSAMRRAVRLGGLPAATAAAALRAFAGLNLVRHPAARLASRMWDMRDTVTTYDSAYVALAEALDVPLMTADRRLARAASMYCAVLAV